MLFLTLCIYRTLDRQSLFYGLKLFSFLCSVTYFRSFWIFKILVQGGSYSIWGSTPPPPLLPLSSLASVQYVKTPPAGKKVFYCRLAAVQMTVCVINTTFDTQPVENFY